MNRFGEGRATWPAGPETLGDTALIRVSGSAGAPDTSNAPFLVANAGNSFYVNDGDRTGDEYTDAVGDNANAASIHARKADYYIGGKSGQYFKKIPMSCSWEACFKNV